MRLLLLHMMKSFRVSIYHYFDTVVSSILFFTEIYIAAIIIGGSLSLFILVTTVILAVAYWKRNKTARVTIRPFYEDINEYVQQTPNPVYEVLHVAKNELESQFDVINNECYGKLHT